MKKKIICIDISNVVPGKGGTGGGITTYAINLIKHLDILLDDNSSEIYCIKNDELTTLGQLRNIRIINVKVKNSNLLSRLYWLHIRLPLFCKKKKVVVLHRIVPELPFLKVCKYIITMHDFMFDFYLQRQELKKYLSKASVFKFKFLRFVSNVAIRTSDGIITPAETIKGALANKFRNQGKKAAVIYEASEFPGCDPIIIGKKRSVLNIGVVAGFYPHKGHLNVVKLARHFLDLGFHDFKIFMRGSQVYKSYVEQIKKDIIKSGLENFIVFEPFIRKITLKEIYARLDLVLLLSEYEGFGLPVLEAQSHSVPVVCSGIPIFKEILQESVFYLNSDFTSEDVAVFLKEIRNDEKLQVKIKEGLNNVKRFSWHNMSRETLSLYESFP